MRRAKRYTRVHFRHFRTKRRFIQDESIFLPFDGDGDEEFCGEFGWMTGCPDQRDEGE
jgi:hypothetical protein